MSDIKQHNMKEGNTLCVEIAHSNQGELLYCRQLLYCKHHNKLICDECAKSRHVDCDVCEIEEELKHERQKLDDLLECLKPYGDHLRQNIADTNRAFDQSGRDIQDIGQKVETTMQDLMTRIVKMKTDILQKIEDIKEGRNQAEVTSRHKQHLADIELVELSLIQLIEESDLNNITQGIEKIKHTLIEIPTDVPTFSWSYTQGEQLKHPDKLIGDVFLDTKTTKSKADQENSEDHSIVEIQTHGEGNGAISDIIDLGPVILTSRNASSNICIYNWLSGEKIQTITVPGLKSPFGGMVCLDQEGPEEIEIVVSDMPSKCLHFLTLSSESLTAQSDKVETLESRDNTGKFTSLTAQSDKIAALTWNLLEHDIKRLAYYPSGITLHQEGPLKEMIVTDHTNKKVHIYDEEGMEKREIELPFEKFSSPRYALRVAGGGFVVADTGMKQLIWVDDKGRVLRTYSGTDEKELRDAQKLCLSPDTGHLIVADAGSNTVQELDSQGSWVRTLADDGTNTKKPLAVHLASNGKLCIGSSGDKIQILQYLQPTGPRIRCSPVKTSCSVILKLCNWN